MAEVAFVEGVAKFYEDFMVPMVFEPYAEDLVERLSARPTGKVLETAAGTGIVTRKLAKLRTNPPEVLIATDVSQAMIEMGEQICAEPTISWRQADAVDLPFADASFDLVVCQFGAMFFKDRPKAYAEARRVLRAGGRFVFNVWDHIPNNEFAFTVSEAVKALFSSNPPTFLERVPHGCDEASVRRDLATAGFTGEAVVEPVVLRSRASSAALPAQAYVKGTPLRGEIKERDPSLLDAAQATAEAALIQRFGSGAIEGQMKAFLITVTA